MSRRALTLCGRPATFPRASVQVRRFPTPVSQRANWSDQRMPESLAQDPALPAMTLPDVMRLLESDLDRFEAAIESLDRVDIPLSRAILDHVLSLRGKRARPLLLMLVARLGEKRDDDE